MFDVIFGWRKASKCKKLLRRVQCRLKLLKNKRSSILRHSRDDVAQLLRFGYDHNAFDRVEYIIKDESMLAVYDLLEAFCEFIIINLPYIRKHRDCPNDINEAVSTLVFASARCGDLPELRKLRNLFGKRYGHKTTKIALELLPGNLVNQTIKENLTMGSVTDDAKYKLMDEIDRSIQVEPLALEYTSEWQQLGTTTPESHSLTKLQESHSHDSEMIPESSTDGMHSAYGDFDLQASNFSKDERNEEGNKSPLAPDYLNQSFLAERNKEGSIYEDSTSEILSDQKPEKIVYLDDIEEFKYPIWKDGNSIQDQRLFLFKSSDSARKKSEVRYDGDIELYSSVDKKVSSRSYVKNRKADGNKWRKRLHSGENRNANDVESAIYYGNFMNPNHKPNDRRDHPKKMQKKDSLKLFITSDQHSENIVNNCSLEDPCYLCIGNDKEDSESPPLQHKRRMAAAEHTSGLYNSSSPCNGVTIAKPGTVHKEVMCMHHLPDKQTSQVEQEAKSVSTLISQKETPHFYLRAITLPPKRPKDYQTDSILRSNSFPFQQPADHWRNALRSPRSHPKLPDYDELAAHFMTLKKATLQKQLQRRK
ncbi:hypothetical protein POM88_006109 [Heracleum sosnowskyi]|uniref:Uncharacterized protein n=1 Tax=Heracleum sosnowskyi TaxID=360622 RepID=A0AAD8J2U8_9APIA|nr:hypothetical protein POM88_006109 [Heracleum sosnowskyi]